LWKADEVGTTDTAKKAIKDLFDGVEVFDTPKPVPLMQRIVQISTQSNTSDIVLDFFGGSAPIGEAIYRQNLIDSGNRRFFIVQLPEELPEDSPARQMRFSTLSAVAVDRLRRAGKKIDEERSPAARRIFMAGDWTESRTLHSGNQGRRHYGPVLILGFRA
jgi:adenine-specific DNA-methyltransferase